MNNYSEPIRAAELLARRISSFQSVKRTAPDSEISILDFLAAVKNRGWQNSVASIRTAFAAGNAARQMQFAPARTWRNATHGTVARSGARAFPVQGGTISRPRPACRLGAGFVGESVSRAWLQTQRLADATSGGIKVTLVTWRELRV